MGDKILQWNVRGYQANHEELLLLTRFYQPCVLALQETLPSDCSKMSLSGYTVLHRSSGRDSTSGGVALLINQNILSSAVDLDTNLQAVAARISFGKTVTVCKCNIYLHGWEIAVILRNFRKTKLSKSKFFFFFF